MTVWLEHLATLIVPLLRPTSLRGPTEITIRTYFGQELAWRPTVLDLCQRHLHGSLVLHS
jgi:hypothetical protein